MRGCDAARTCQHRRTSEAQRTPRLTVANAMRDDWDAKAIVQILAVGDFEDATWMPECTNSPCFFKSN
jgi:hypothetical protein